MTSVAMYMAPFMYRARRLIAGAVLYKVAFCTEDAYSRLRAVQMHAAKIATFAAISKFVTRSVILELDARICDARLTDVAPAFYSTY